jgi:hypothetical protein
MNSDASDRTDQSVAEVTGRLAGQAVNRIGIGLLRMGPVRSALRRAVAEARAETDEDQTDSRPAHTPAPDAAPNPTEERSHDGNQS